MYGYDSSHFRGGNDKHGKSTIKYESDCKKDKRELMKWFLAGHLYSRFLPLTKSEAASSGISQLSTVFFPILSSSG